jgi:hypothetical protein
MAQSLELNIKTTSDVPQAMDKAKAATVSFGKQMEDIKKKFSTSFKDIFLGFFAPMVLLQSAISSVSGAIEDARRRAQEGLDLLAKGDSMFVSSHERRMAMYFKERQEREKESESAKEGRAESTKMFLETTPEGQKLLDQLRRENMANYLINPRFTANMASREDVQKRALEAFSGSDEGKAAIQWEETQRKQKLAAERIRKEEEEAKVKAAKQTGKEGLSAPNSMSGNIIGVGSNPVVIALQEQQAIQREQLAYLQIIASNKTASPAADVTASGATPSTPANASPSRAALLTKNK